MENKDIFLESSSGFMMPFISDDDRETTEIMLGYGDQTHPHTGMTFHHSGIDYVCPHMPLLAVATGTVVAVGNDATHDNYIITRYGAFDVKYGHIERAVVGYGAKVSAGQQIAVSGDFLHLSVSFAGKEIDPQEFINMIYSNMCTLLSLGIQTYPQLETPDVEVKTDYDKDKDSIMELMFKYLPSYFSDLYNNVYRPSENTEASLRNVLSQAASRGYFFESLPSLFNPAGITHRAGDIIGKVHNTLIYDFLSYLAVCKDVYVPGMSEQQKKNLKNSLKQKAS